MGQGQQCLPWWDFARPDPKADFKTSSAAVKFKRHQPPGLQPRAVANHRDARPRWWCKPDVALRARILHDTWLSLDGALYAESDLLLQGR